MLASNLFSLSPWYCTYLLSVLRYMSMVCDVFLLANVVLLMFGNNLSFLLWFHSIWCVSLPVAFFRVFCFVCFFMFGTQQFGCEYLWEALFIFVMLGGCWASWFCGWSFHTVLEVFSDDCFRYSGATSLPSLLLEFFHWSMRNSLTLSHGTLRHYSLKKKIIAPF